MFLTLNIFILEETFDHILPYSFGTTVYDLKPVFLNTENMFFIVIYGQA